MFVFAFQYVRGNEKVVNRYYDKMFNNPICHCLWFVFKR